MAQRWVAQGATFLHLVDLDGAMLEAQLTDCVEDGTEAPARATRHVQRRPGFGHPCIGVKQSGEILARFESAQSEDERPGQSAGHAKRGDLLLG